MKTTTLLCIIVFLAIVLPFCEGRRHKGWQEEKSDFARRRERGEGGLTPIEPTQGPTNEDQKDKLPHHNKNFEDHEKHKWNKDGKEHHKGYKHHDHSFKEHKFPLFNPNITTYFVEHSLPPSVYIVLEDKGIQVKAAYEQLGNDTVLTKVGVRLAEKNIVVSANGNLAVDGQEFDVSEVEEMEFGNGKMMKKGRMLVVQYDNYHVFMKVRCQHSDKKGRQWEEDKDRNAQLPPRIGVIIGVEKTAVVSPAGFIGARMAVDPTKCIQIGIVFRK